MVPHWGIFMERYNRFSTISSFTGGLTPPRSEEMGRHHRFSPIRPLLVAAIVYHLLMNVGSAAPPPLNYVTVSFGTVMQNGLPNSTLALTGDDGDNLINVVWKAGVVTVTATGQTRIGNSGSSSKSVTFRTGTSFNVNGTFNGGNDYVSFSTMLAPNVSVNLGDGNDVVKFTYCSIGSLTVDGGTGSNTFVQVASKVTTSAITNIQNFFPPH